MTKVLNNQDYIKAANAKFGKVMKAVMVDLGLHHDLVLLIKRDRPVFEDAPYMTITAYQVDGEPAFSNGHYDLTEEQAIQSLKERVQKHLNWI